MNTYHGHVSKYVHCIRDIDNNKYASKINDNCVSSIYEVIIIIIIIILFFLLLLHFFLMFGDIVYMCVN